MQAKVEDLHKLKLVHPEPGMTSLTIDPEMEDAATIWSVPISGSFESHEEAKKAAALFRASYQMQQAIKAFVDDESDEDERTRYDRLWAALHLSENTAEFAE